MAHAVVYPRTVVIHLDHTFAANGAMMSTGGFGEEALLTGSRGHVRAGRSEAWIAKGSVAIVENHVQVDENTEKEVEAR